MVTNSKSSWKQEKYKTKSLQKNAFRSPKANPFAIFKYDPNNAESHLDELATLSDLNSTIIPPKPFASSNSAQATVGKKYRAGYSLRTPARNGIVNSIRKRKRGGTKLIGNIKDLLQQKANEQNSYAMQKQLITSQPQMMPRSPMAMSEQCLNFQNELQSSSSQVMKGISQTTPTFLSENNSFLSPQTNIYQANRDTDCTFTNDHVYLRQIPISQNEHLINNEHNHSSRLAPMMSTCQQYEGRSRNMSDETHSHLHNNMIASFSKAENNHEKNSLKNYPHQNNAISGNNNEHGLPVVNCGYFHNETMFNDDISKDTKDFKELLDDAFFD